MLKKRHVSAFLAIIRLQISTSLYIVCVLWMLIYNHLYKILYMRYNLRVSMYGDGRAKVCGIVGVGNLHGFCRFLCWGVSAWRIIEDHWHIF